MLCCVTQMRFYPDAVHITHMHIAQIHHPQTEMIIVSKNYLTYRFFNNKVQYFFILLVNKKF